MYTQQIEVAAHYENQMTNSSCSFKCEMFPPMYLNVRPIVVDPGTEQSHLCLIQ